LAELSKSNLNFVQRAAGEALLRIGTPEAQAAARPYERRKELWDGFYRGMSIFVGRPLAALAISLGFGLVWAGVVFVIPGKRIRTWPLGIPTVLWALYAAWEYECAREQANIRIDLLVLYPVLAISTLAALVFWVICLLRAKNIAPT
jgi:hypothetical protein